MKKSKFTESQIIGYLRRMEQGEKTADLCREAGISQGTMYQWKSKYSGSADFSGEWSNLSKDFLESVEEVFGVCNPSEVGSEEFDLSV
mgnify:CR=1 FL=1